MKRAFALFALILGANCAFAESESDCMVGAKFPPAQAKIVCGDLSISGAVTPDTDDSYDLGTSSLEFQDAFFDGVVKTDGLEVDATDIRATTSGVTLAIQEATAGAKCMGTATANGTTAVTVSTTCATTGSRILLTRSSAPSGTADCWQTNIVNGVSFDLDCTGAETGTFDWFILHEAP